MKKMILIGLAALSLSNGAFASDFFSVNNPSEASLLSGASIVIASIAIPFVLLDDLSASHNYKNENTNNYYTTNNYTTMTVNSLTPLNNGNVQLNTTIKGKENKDYSFEIPKKAVKNCDIVSGTQIEVDKNNAGYTLHANNKVIGIVSNEKTTHYFKQEKQ